MHLLSRTWTILILSTALAIAVAAVFPKVFAGRFGLPYGDDFRQGSLAGWTAYGGNWRAADGIVQNDSDDRGAKLVAGSSQLSDYEINADVQLTSRFGDAGVLLRVTEPEEGANAFYGYYVGLRQPDILLIGKSDLGFRPLAQLTLSKPIVPNAWHHLAVRMQGCRMHAVAKDPNGRLLADLEIMDARCYPAGNFGLRSFESGGMWRNVRVTPVP